MSDRKRALREADVREACVDILGVSDSFYTRQQVRDLGQSSHESAQHIAAILHGAAVDDIVDVCEYIVRQVRSSATRHDTGTVYTPQGVVRLMVGDASPNAFDTVVDMGCGCGRFSLEAKLSSPGTRVIGLDLDPLACLLAATVSKLTGVCFEVIQGDYLDTDVSPVGRTLFIGNPPYVRHHKLTDDQKSSGHQMAAKLGVDGWSGLAGLYALFMMKTLCRAHKGDRMMVVTGAEWLDVGYGKPLREAFASGIGGGRSLTYYPASMDLFGGAMSTALISCWDVGVEHAEVRCAVDGGERFYAPSSMLAGMRKWGDLFSGKNRPASSMDTIALGELFRVSRGIVTGCNEYFVLPADDPQAVAMGDRAIPVVARATDVPHSGSVEPGTLKKRLLLLDPVKDADYVGRGVEMGVPNGFVASHRAEWYVVKTKPAPVLATYMRRGRPRFALNPSGCANLNTVHGLYPRKALSRDDLARIVDYLNNGELYGDTGRVYQGGLVKYEPGEMERIEIPSSVIHGKGEHDA